MNFPEQLFRHKVPKMLPAKDKIIRDTICLLFQR